LYRYISGNVLEHLPSMCGNQGLTRLDASDNRLVALPEDLAECCKLRELVANGNGDLALLPQDLGLFQPDLRGVWARGCGLLALPRWGCTR
jgi:Leucine-rich repeat (LRR) protein